MDISRSPGGAFLNLLSLTNEQEFRDGHTRIHYQDLANGTRASYTYDEVGHIVKLWNMTRDGMTVISGLDYAYDGAGNRIRVIEGSGVRVTWSYDNNYQLIRERRNGAKMLMTSRTVTIPQATVGLMSMSRFGRRTLMTR